MEIVWDWQEKNVVPNDSRRIVEMRSQIWISQSEGRAENQDLDIASLRAGMCSFVLWENQDVSQQGGSENKAFCKQGGKEKWKLQQFAKVCVHRCHLFLRCAVALHILQESAREISKYRLMQFALTLKGVYNGPLVFKGDWFKNIQVPHMKWYSVCT